MAATIVVLELVSFDSRRIPKKSKKLGQVLVFTDNITKINNTPIALGVSQHSGFCVRVRKPGAAGGPDMWLCRAGFLLPGIPNIFPQGGQIQARGLLDFSGTLPTNKVAITGGTGDYIRAGGEIELKTPRSRTPRDLGVHAQNRDPMRAAYQLGLIEP